MWPATDLCWTCQKNDNRIHRTVNFPEVEKVEAVRAQEEHLLLASGEREQYINCCKESKLHVQRFLVEVDFAHGCEPCSYNGTMIMQNSSITLQIQTNRGEFISRHLENVDSLVFVVKPYLAS